MPFTQNQQKSTGGLRDRLEDYASRARSAGTRATLRQRMGNWPIYAAATGSAMAMATSASAGIIYSGVLSKNLAIPASQRGFRSGTEQIGIAPALRIGLSQIPYQTNGEPSPLAGVFAELGSPGQLLDVAQYGIVRNLASGAVISAGAAGVFSNTGGLLKAKNVGSANGNWVTDVPAFEGFRFGTGLGQFDYGWAELRVGVQNGLPNSVALLGMAYNDNPGASILAGQTTEDSSAPEPGTAGLMLLALGAAGVTLLRRRKQIAR